MLSRVLVARTDSPGSLRPKLITLVRRAVRTRHYSGRTEAAYVYWIKRYVRHRVSAATQAQAAAALLFL